MKIRQMFRETLDRIRQTHNDVGLHGHHDFGHAYRVATIAYEVALYEWGNTRIAELAALSGLCHNADHVIVIRDNLEGRRYVPAEAISALINEWISDVLEEPDELTTVVNAVLRHGGRNGEDDSHVQIALQDADRVVNLSVDLLPRSGQNFPTLPAVDYVHLGNDPEATYRNPKSVWRDILYSLDWVKTDSGVCCRTKLGLQIATEYAETFRMITDLLQKQLGRQGIYPYPFAEQQ